MGLRGAQNGYQWAGIRREGGRESEKERDREKEREPNLKVCFLPVG